MYYYEFSNGDLTFTVYAANYFGALSELEKIDGVDDISDWQLINKY